MQRLLSAVTALLLILALASTGYCAFQYVGPYQWIAEAQLSLFGSYEVQITFVLTLLACLLPILVIVIPLRRILAAHAPTDLTGTPMSTASVQPTVDADHWIRNNRGSLLLGILSAMTFGLGAYLVIDAASMGERTELDVSVLESGGAPASRHVILGGALRRDLVMSVTEEHTTRVYVPIVRTTPMQPVVYLETYDVWLDTYASDLSTGRFEGVLYENGLPGMVRESYAAQGILPPRHYTLDYRRTPAERWETATISLTVAVVAALVLAVIRALVWIRR